MQTHTRRSIVGRLRSLLLTLALLLAPLLGLAATPALAATLSVSNTNNSGPGSLRQAIADAAPGDTITFALPNPSVITLSSELVIAKDLTINGPGAAALTISGNDAIRVFFINPGAPGATSGPPATSLAVTISNMTIANGKAKGGDGGPAGNGGGSGGAAGMGGAIFGNNATLMISGVTFSANQARGGNFFGGGGSFWGGSGGGGFGGNGGGNRFPGGGGGSGGALGGLGGGGGASGFFGNGGNGGSGGDGAGGGGGGSGDDCPRNDDFQCVGPGYHGGNGGTGGFGSGGGGGGSSGYDETSIAVGGIGGAGGFGGGGGGAGGAQSGGVESRPGGAGGSFGGNGGGSDYESGGQGGGGAGLGGAIFIRAGSLTLAGSSFSNNTAVGGNGAQNGQGKGGAIFLLPPASLNATNCTTFSGNSATDAAGSGADTNDIYSGSTPTLPPCDTTAPAITPNVAGTLGNNGWYTSDVTVSWSVTDAESSISSQTGCDSSTVSSDTSGVTFTCQATSAGGSSSQSVTIQRDATAPMISAAASSSPNANTWYNAPVTVHFTCDDNLSSIASCPADQALSGEGAAVSSTAQSATDVAGNSASSNIVTVAIDRTAPVVSVTGVSNGASYPIGSVPMAACSTSDNLSGVATAATISISGGNADGSGSFTATCAGASDKAGNSGAASVSYSVAYRWSGFFQPIDILPTINSVNAGKAVPVKFSLGGNYGLNIFAAGYPASQQVACSGSAPIDEIEQTVTAGNSSLSYDATSGQYSYTWKTDKAWAGQCRLLIVRLIDGTEHTASFKFK